MNLSAVGGELFGVSAAPTFPSTGPSSFGAQLHAAAGANTAAAADLTLMLAALVGARGGSPDLPAARLYAQLTPAPAPAPAAACSLGARAGAVGDGRRRDVDPSGWVMGVVDIVRPTPPLWPSCLGEPAQAPRFSVQELARVSAFTQQCRVAATPIEMTIAPPMGGTLNVRAQMCAGLVSLTLIVSNTTLYDALQRQRSTLCELLKQAGVQLGSVNISCVSADAVDENQPCEQPPMRRPRTYLRRPGDLS